jgi:hypothetical protein
MPTAKTAEQDAFDPGFVPMAPVGGAEKKAGRSIALASPASDTSFAAVSADEASGGFGEPARPPRDARPARMGDDTLEGWCLRTGHGERRDLSLAEIRNMALAGTITARTMVKRPGGDWMAAGQFAPLRAVFASLADNPRPASREREASHRDPLPPFLALTLAWGGALGGCIIAALGWWLGAIVAGQELAPLAALGGLFGGFAASWLSRLEGRPTAVAGAVAGALSVIAGRYLVFETLRSGVVTFAGVERPATLIAFVQQGLTASFGISLAASILLGMLLGYLGAGRPR